MFFGGGERANARTPSQTLRVARGPSDVRPVCGWGVGGMGPQTVSIPSLSGDGVPTIGLTNGRVNRNARHTQIVLWFIQRLLPEGLTQSSHKRHPKVHFSDRQHRGRYCCAADSRACGQARLRPVLPRPILDVSLGPQAKSS